MSAVPIGRIVAPSERTGVLEGQLGMDAALQRVSQTDWTPKARKAVAALCDRGTTFTADDVRRIAGDPPGSPNALGALLNTIATEGWIVRVGDTKSTRPEAHGRRMGVWKAAA